MSYSVFQIARLSDRSILQKLFKQHPEENAVIELNNLLASKAIKAISQADIDTIEQKYGLRLVQEFRLNLEEFYATYLSACLTNQILSQEEVAELKHLKTILFLDEKIVTKLHSQISAIVYKKSFEEAIADGRLTNEKKEFLNKLETDLQLARTVAEQISLVTRTEFIENYASKVLAEKRFSPDEEREMQEISTSLDLHDSLDNQTQQKLKKLKIYWALENLELPSFETTISIQKSEQCYFQIGNVKWFELRNSNQRVSYNSSWAKMGIAKDFYLNIEPNNSKSYDTAQMKLIDNGILCLTNKRIIFSSDTKNSIIRIEKILEIIPHTDGVEIHKETGKSLKLQFPDKADIFYMILERLLREILKKSC